MKVIFIEDVSNVARAGQTKVVADGYARNFLFPRKLAVLANSRDAVAIEAHIRKYAKRRAIEEAEMKELAQAINGVEITLKAKVGENERLYGSVTGADIAGELGQKISREVDKRKIELAEPIRQVGVYDVTVRFAHEITAVVCVTVMSDAEDAVRPVREEKVEEKAAEPEPAIAAAEAPAENIVEAEAEPAAEKTGEPVKKTRKAKKEVKEEAKAEEAAPAPAEKKEKKPKAEKKAKKEEAPAAEAPAEETPVEEAEE